MADSDAKSGKIRSKGLGNLTLVQIISWEEILEEMSVQKKLEPFKNLILTVQLQMIKRRKVDTRIMMVAIKEVIE